MPPPGNPASLKGILERITYQDEQSGYTVAQVQVKGRRELVTVVGHMAQAAVGSILEMVGKWELHSRFGQQFRIESCRVSLPASQYGIQKYLGSGLVKGLGPEMASRIVGRFGDNTLMVIENTPEKLLEVDGIGPKRLDLIKKAWQAQKHIRELMIFLQSHDISAAYAIRIYKAYGDQALEVVNQNPYRLAADIWGIGFLTADRIATKLGFSTESSLRIEAGVLYVLSRAADEGHCYLPYQELIKRCHSILQVPDEAVRQAVADLASSRQITIEDLNQNLEHFLADSKAIYLAALHHCETSIASRLARLNSIKRQALPLIPKASLSWIQNRLDVKLASNQCKALETALKARPMVITGGPGTGKTTLIKAIIGLYAKAGKRVMLAAPTGRAAKRMTEATGHGAKTIHRLLGYQPGHGFQKNDQHPLECDLLIVDEASMIDTVLMYHLLKAIDFSTSLILVGDVHQLPSVGAGNVLKDIIASGALPVVELNEIFRQASKSRIVINAHRILAGKMPLKGPPPGGRLTDYYFIEQTEPENVLQTVLTVVTERIPRRFGLSATNQIQVLTPMHRGSLGAMNLNRLLQQSLNGAAEYLEHGGRRLAVGDRIMQLRNDYDKQVFNGDIGFIASMDKIQRCLQVNFDNRLVEYDFSELDQLSLAYAVSIHKAQGSEYPAVVIPFTTQHYVMLQRNLIYTALTRASRLAVLVGTKQALAIAIGNNAPQLRYTGLAAKLGQHLP